MIENDGNVLYLLDTAGKLISFLLRASKTHERPYSSELLNQIRATFKIYARNLRLPKWRRMSLDFSFDLFSQALAELADVQVNFCADADVFGGRTVPNHDYAKNELILRLFSSFNFWINFDEKIFLGLLKFI